jgi:hypothetical protein
MVMFPVVRNHSRPLTDLFGNTHLCEQFFSKMNMAKNVSGNQLDEERLENHLLADTSELCTDFIG